MNCIIKYKEDKNESFCNKLKECIECNNKEKRETENNCNVEIGGYCTCGYAIRA